MAEWISVYCQESIRLDGDEIRRWIETADLWTWAETLYDEDELAEAAAESVLTNLRVQAETTIDVYWTESGRPLQISVSPAAAEDISEVVNEALSTADGPGPALIRDHLAAVRHVINIEMSAADSMSMGAVLGEIVALEIAAVGNGLVWFFGKDWVSPEDRAGTVWNRN
ncbi:hypothetical protein [Nocardia concava]|uniref:hypothetical protein n=1 Tax=Nocardia concava TaxID=257281 RepID=UPI0012F74929|nr:hypothetical protein [Nocardia concava]